MTKFKEFVSNVIFLRAIDSSFSAYLICKTNTTWIVDTDSLNTIKWEF